MDEGVGQPGAGGSGSVTTPKIAVASTLAAYKALPDRDPMESEAWLSSIAAWREQGHDIEVLAVLQYGQGHDEAYAPLISRLAAFEAVVWTYAINNGEESITTDSRLAAICTGRNLAHEFVVRRQDFTHLLLVDSDIEPPEDGLSMLLEVDHPIVGGHVPTYCLDGPPVEIREHGPSKGYKWTLGNGTWGVGLDRPFPVGADVHEHWNTAGSLLIRRDAVLGLRWGWDLDRGMTDDPWFQDRAVALGFGQTWVRHDSCWTHHPQSIGPLETRGHDLSILVDQ